MARIMIPYFSGSGNTRRLAGRVAMFVAGTHECHPKGGSVS